MNHFVLVGVTNKMQIEIEILKDKQNPGDWRVEWSDEDGSCYVTIFSGPFADLRAIQYGITAEGLSNYFNNYSKKLEKYRKKGKNESIS